MRSAFATLVAVTALLATAAGCGSDDTGPEPPDIETTVFAPALGVDPSLMTRTASGLYWRDLAVGAGSSATVGLRASVRYTGWLPDGTQFDTNIGAAAPFQFVVGGGQTIAGFDEGTRGMRVGGQRQLIIPPALGYGATGQGPIPPNAILIFRIELVALQ
jgi:peptidylprolyl isomerase